ncbi:ESX secretion-associated protein EspG [Lolliginicoccus suaedae]|uniref:ESX secretion-associated protein EspG n=1 Tax=Lolliginicoccus suaedae TaxID=2605429 RepID=UPI001659B503|nr:ESX secretion-associated protein EspG [Lolliginicoccus suaedae]
MASVTVSVTELALLQAAAGLDELPVALQVPLGSDDQVARAVLRERGLLTERGPSTSVLPLLRALAAPEASVSARASVVGADAGEAMHRGVVARRGDQVVGAIRLADSVRLQAIDGSVAGFLLDVVGPAPRGRELSARDTVVRHEAFASAVDGARDANAVILGLRQAGVAAEDAFQYGQVLHDADRVVEVTAPGRAALAVIDAKQGRILVCPLDQPDAAVQRVTVCAGSEHRLRRALDHLWRPGTQSSHRIADRGAVRA